MKKRGKHPLIRKGRGRVGGSRIMSRIRSVVQVSWTLKGAVKVFKSRRTGRHGIISDETEHWKRRLS